MNEERNLPSAMKSINYSRLASFEKHSTPTGFLIRPREGKKGKWRVCIDFTNLNEAYPKDSYPLLRID